MADVLANQIIASCGDYVALAHITKPVEDLAHARRHGGLTGARSPRE